MSARDEIIGIQHLRGLAALAVVVDHTQGMLADPRYFGVKLLGGMLHGGRAGVDVFFLISGFIIAVVSLEGARMTPRIGTAEFLKRRFIRIVPLMWIAILAFVGLRLLGRGMWDPMATLRTMLLLPWRGMMPSHIWTLRQELFFYLLFAATMLGGRRLGWVFPVWGVAGLIVFQFRHLFGVNSNMPVFWLFHSTNIEFCAGLALAVLWLRGSSELRFRLPVDPWLVLAALTFGLLFVVIPLLHLYSGLAIALLAMPLLFVAIHVQCPPARLRAFGELLGNASYSIYLFHPLTISAAAPILVHVAPRAPVWVAAIVITLVATSTGLAAHFVIERPLLAVLRRRTRTGTGPLAADASQAPP